MLCVGLPGSGKTSLLRLFAAFESDFTSCPRDRVETENGATQKNEKKDVVNGILSKSGYDMVDDDADFKYLVRLPMDSVTEENVERIMKEKETKLSELERLKATTEQRMWLQEIGTLRDAYQMYKKTRANEVTKIKVAKKLKVKKKVAKKE